MDQNKNNGGTGPPPQAARRRVRLRELAPPQQQQNRRVARFPSTLRTLALLHFAQIECSAYRSTSSRERAGDRPPLHADQIRGIRAAQQLAALPKPRPDSIIAQLPDLRSLDFCQNGRQTVFTEKIVSHPQRVIRERVYS
jgi:hypothetical protein